MAASDVQLLIDGKDIADVAIKSLKYRLSFEQITKIATILAKGDRVELIPGKDGVKVIQESRKEVK